MLMREEGKKPTPLSVIEAAFKPHRKCRGEADVCASVWANMADSPDLKERE